MKEYTSNNQDLAEYYSRSKVESVLKDAESEEEKDTLGEGEDSEDTKQNLDNKKSFEKRLDVTLNDSRRKTVGDVPDKGIDFSNDLEEKKGSLKINTSLEPHFNLAGRQPLEEFGNATLENHFGNYERSRKTSSSSIYKRTKKDLMKMIKYFLPISQRIYKIKSTSIDIRLANTIITALRNYMNDGKTRQSTLTKSNSFSYEELEQFQVEIENKKRKQGKKNPLENPVTMFSLQVIESLNASLFKD